MAIGTPVATNASAATLASPAGALGDVIIWATYRDTAATIPTLAAGTSKILSGSGSVNAYLIAYEFCTVTTAISRTFTGATRIVATRVSGVLGIGAAVAGAIAATSPANFAAATLIQSAGASKWFGFGGHKTATVGAPTNMVAIASGQAGTGPSLSVYATAATASNWPSTNVTVTAAAHCTGVIELLGTKSTWSPYDFNGTPTSITFSNSNLTATSGSNPAQANGVRSFIPRATGKFGFGWTITTIGSTFSEYLGLVTATAALTQIAGLNNASGLSVTFSATASTAQWLNATNTNNSAILGTIAQGDSGYCVFDLTSGLAWVKSTTMPNWNGSALANPDTGVGGFVYTDVVGTFLIPYYATGNLGSVMVVNLDDISGAGLSTFTAWDKTPVTTPFVLQDWGMPVIAAKRDQAINSQTEGLPGVLGLLVGQDAFPPRAYDYPNPTLAISRMQAMLTIQLGAPRNINLLIGQDTFYGAAGEVVYYDWPNPQGPPSRAGAIASQPQGGFLGFSSSTAAPFAALDWPVPPRPKYAPETMELGTAPNLTLLPGKDALPFALRDWPNPRGAAQPIQTQPFGTAPLLTELVGQDVLPFRFKEWSNPLARAQTAQTQPLGVPAALLPLPFALYDWPNSAGSKQPAQTQPLGTASILTLLVGKDVLPIRLLDQPIPRGAFQPFQTQPQGSWTQGLQAAPKPFAQTDWLNPNAARTVPGSVSSQPQGTATLLTLLAGKDQLPFRHSDWINPRRAATPAQTQPLGSSQQVLKPAAQPFFQADWSNPVGPRPRPDTQPLGSAPATFITPFAQYDWLVPSGVRRAQPEILGSWTFLLNVPRPFAELDWPNPAVSAWRAQPHTLGSWISLLQSPRPFALQDWPLPAPRARQGESQPLGGVVQSAPVFNRPFAQIDWPNPRRQALPIQTQPLGGFSPLIRPAPPASPCNTVSGGIRERLAEGDYSTRLSLSSVRVRVVLGDYRTRLLLSSARTRLVDGGCF